MKRKGKVASLLARIWGKFWTIERIQPLQPLRTGMPAQRCCKCFLPFSARSVLVGF